jgi:hypothetical protein
LKEKKDTREGVNIACGIDRWSTFETRTVRGVDRLQQKEVSSKGIHSSTLWNYASLSLLQLPFSENDVRRYHGMEVEGKHCPVVNLTARAVLIASSSPRLPIRTKS